MRARHLFATVLAGLLVCGPVQAATITLQAELFGANEVPGPGDPDGSGFAIFTIDDVALTVSWVVTVTGIDTVNNAHIHPGVAGEFGPPLIDFMAQLTGGPLASADLAQVLADPSAFYYNVHTELFPAGALRGQLERVSVVEPGTAGLLLLGLIGVAGIRRRA